WKRRRPPSRSLCSSCSHQLCRLRRHQPRFADLRELDAPSDPVHVQEDGIALEPIEPARQTLASVASLLQLDANVPAHEPSEMLRRPELPIEPGRRDLEVIRARQRILHVEQRADLPADELAIRERHTTLRVRATVDIETQEAVPPKPQID